MNNYENYDLYGNDIYARFPERELDIEAATDSRDRLDDERDFGVGPVEGRPIRTLSEWTYYYETLKTGPTLAE